MESPASAAGPRVYVPITHPDSPVPTYAVLQFLGFSPPPDPKQSPILHTHFVPPATPPPATTKLLPCASPVSNPPSPAPKRGTSPTDSSSNSSSDEKDKKLISIKPSPMKKSASGGALASALSPGPRRNGKSLPLGPTISISHTDKDTIIHTDYSNFREVVHQLTGATSGDKGLMPVTMPARTIIRGGTSSGDKDVSPMAMPMRGGETSQINHKQEAFGITSPKLIETGCIRRPIGTTTTKLLERRKSNKVLERLSTSCRNLPPLVPSPVTPLASDFEKICLPLTPTPSEGSSAATISSTVTVKALSGDAKAMEVSLGMPPAHDTISHTHDAEAMEGISAEVNVVGDSMGVHGPSIPRVVRTQSLNLHDRSDGQVPSVRHTARMRRARVADAVDAQGPSLMLVSSRPTGARLADDMVGQHGVATRESGGLHDAMDVEEQRLCTSAGVQGLSSTPSVLGRDSSSAYDEESVIAKKGFFFHSQRPSHGGTTLLHLFPESPREL